MSPSAASTPASPREATVIAPSYLIQGMPNIYSKVTWVGHVEADNQMVHNLYKPLVNSD